MKKSIVSLRLMSDTIGPDELSSGMKTPIDVAWRKGDPRGKTSLTHAENGVEVRVAGEEPENLEEQINLLVTRLDSDAEYIRSLNCDCVQLSIVVYDSQPPCFHLPFEAMTFFASVGASMDLDQYLIDDEDEDE